MNSPFNVFEESEFDMVLLVTHTVTTTQSFHGRKRTGDGTLRPGCGILLCSGRGSVYRYRGDAREDKAAHDMERKRRLKWSADNCCVDQRKFLRKCV